MQKRNAVSRFVALTLCWSLLLPMLPVPARAMDGSKYVEVEVGQPSVWSLGQAHYLLANMHARNRDLSTKLPNEDALDPNRINSSRLETLQRVLSLEAQLDQSVGAKNKAEMQRFENEQERQKQAGIELQARRAALAQVENELLLLNEELATIQELDRQSTEARASTTPPLPASAEDNARKVQIAVIKVRVEQKTQEKTRIEGEITALTTAATTAPTAPNLTGPSLSEGKAGLPSSEAFTKYVDKALDSMGQPSLAATTALDNFVGMQYEIIAKQLTLLRDEVGPEERVIFLELPASIYTVDGWADDYLARVEWEVTHYYDKEPSPKEIQLKTCGDLKEKWKGNDRMYEAGLSPYQIKTCIEDEDGIDGARSGEIFEPQNPPITLDMLNPNDRESAALKDGRRKVRALDIIPRQSSLNVSEYHATVKNVGILGLLKWISGFGAKLDYQQQREAYEQFVQQDVFASGFGKGLNKFGWTFGPQPGTRRLAPGQRTTYAVLAIPRNTLALDIVAKRYVFKRSRAPRKTDVEDFNFHISVPGPKTESFTVERINYSPVPKGRRTTVVIKGSYFSPQLGVMVNGTHLSRVISIARTGSKEVAPPAPGSDVQGEFELANSQQMVLNFSTGPEFVGTPIITLITPEKSLAINYLAVFINNRDKLPISLQSASSYEPMFIDGFSLTPKIEKLGTEEINGKTFVIARLQGKGLRHDCDIWLNNKRLESLKKDPLGPPIRFASAKDIEGSYIRGVEFAVQESTGSYLLFAEDPKQDKWAIRYRQRNRQGFEEASFEQSFAVKPFSHQIRQYLKGTKGGPAEVHLTLASAEKKIKKVTLLEPRPTECELQGVEAKSRRAKCLVPRDGGAERGFITLQVDLDTGDPHFEDITLPLRPSVPAVTNPTTGNASGPANQETFASLKGENLVNVKAVFFGDLEAKIHASDATGLWVKVPRVDGVPKGQSMVVPVLFQMKGEETKTPSGAFYTYFGEPVAPDLVVWPCAGPGPCGPAASAKTSS